ncbi:hypothetical protein GX831_03415 [bacterium]|jgi:hypothetical protein|nr:hypothetical protein [bacterium]
MAHEYLRQVGVPLAFVSNLAERMLFFAKRAGIPEQDDPEGIKSWQQTLLSYLNLPFSITAKKAVEQDIDGYYTQTFLRVYSNAGQTDEHSNPVERAMAQAFSDSNESVISTLKRSQQPYLMLNDGLLGIFIPGGDEREYEFRVDDEITIHKSGIEDEFLPINHVLAKEVKIKDRRSEQATTTRLWEDKRTNRLLFFSDAGRLKNSGYLNQAETLTLPPGRYICLSRFQPRDFEAEQLWDEPSLYLLGIDAHPDQEIIIKNGPACLTIQGESQPYICWNSPSKTSNEGIDIRYGQLKLIVQLSTGMNQLEEGHYQLQLSCRASTDKLVIPLEFDETGTSEIDLTDYIRQRKDWLPFGLRRLLVEMTRSGEKRAIIRSSIFYWHGLSAISSGMTLLCEQLPENLRLDLSENIKKTDDFKYQPESSYSKAFRLVFELSHNRYQNISWNVPGIFIEVESEPKHGKSSRVSRKAGDVETVSLLSNKQIYISANEPGTLSVGDWSLYVDFVSYPTKRLSASMLASRITSQDSSLTFVSDLTGTKITLLELRQPHFVENIESRLNTNQILLSFQTAKKLQGLRIAGEDVIFGTKINITIDDGIKSSEHCESSRVKIMSIPSNDDGYRSLITFELKDLDASAFVFRLDGKIGDVWGCLENEQQGIHAFGVFFADDGRYVNEGDFFGFLDELSDRQSLEILKRVQRLMLPRYSHQSWSQLSWLLSIWSHLVKRWKDRENEAMETLFELATLRPMVSTDPAWLSQYSVGAQLPKIFSQPVEEYKNINFESCDLSRAVRVAVEVNERYPNVFPDLIHVSVASAFENIAAMQNGAKPVGFNLKTYVEALKGTQNTFETRLKLENDSYSPNSGEWLGPAHLLSAKRALETMYERTLSGNERSRGNAIYLSRFLKQCYTSFNNGHLNGQSFRIEPSPKPFDENTPPEFAQRQENLRLLEHCLSVLAYYYRLAARQPERFEEFMTLLEKTEVPIVPSLTYLLQVGDALFAYYFLLWEFVLKEDD